MKYQLQLILILILLNLSNVAFAGSVSYELDSAESEIRFHASSTLHAFQGVSQSVAPVAVVFDAATQKIQLPFQVALPVTSLRTSNSARDRAMQKMFNVKEYPLIVWETESFECQPSSKMSEWICEAQGRFSMHGKSAPRKIQFNVKQDADGWSASGETLLTTSEFDLRPPSVLRMIRVDSKVEVRIKTSWKKHL